MLTKANALIAKQDMDSDLFHEKLNKNIFEVLQATSKASLVTRGGSVYPDKASPPKFGR